ncbi:MAG TPA: hypothetical protein VGS23_00215, partial [Thermoplasmata archaeon]|nr:hypothetical protein [Thermoplasmata archaeon]
MGATRTQSGAGAPPAAVITTLVLANGTRVPGNFLPSNGYRPAALAVDTSTGTVFVANDASNTVSLINDSTGTV